MFEGVGLGWVGGGGGILYHTWTKQTVVIAHRYHGASIAHASSAGYARVLQVLSLEFDSEIFFSQAVNLDYTSSPGCFV